MTTTLVLQIISHQEELIFFLIASLRDLFVLEFSWLEKNNPTTDYSITFNTNIRPQSLNWIALAPPLAWTNGVSRTHSPIVELYRHVSYSRENRFQLGLPLPNLSNSDATTHHDSLPEDFMYYHIIDYEDFTGVFEKSNVYCLQLSDWSSGRRVSTIWSLLWAIWTKVGGSTNFYQWEL